MATCSNQEVMRKTVLHVRATVKNTGVEPSAEITELLEALENGDTSCAGLRHLGQKPAAANAAAADESPAKSIEGPSPGPEGLREGGEMAIALSPHSGEGGIQEVKDFFPFRV